MSFHQDPRTRNTRKLLDTPRYYHKLLKLMPPIWSENKIEKKLNEVKNCKFHKYLHWKISKQIKLKVWQQNLYEFCFFEFLKDICFFLQISCQKLVFDAFRVIFGGFGWFGMLWLLELVNSFQFEWIKILASKTNYTKYLIDHRIDSSSAIVYWVRGVNHYWNTEMCWNILKNTENVFYFSVVIHHS